MSEKADVTSCKERPRGCAAAEQEGLLWESFSPTCLGLILCSIREGEGSSQKYLRLPVTDNLENGEAALKTGKSEADLAGKRWVCGL